MDDLVELTGLIDDQPRDVVEDRFVRSRRHGHLAVMVTYHLAQAALATSLVV